MRERGRARPRRAPRAGARPAPATGTQSSPGSSGATSCRAAPSTSSSSGRPGASTRTASTGSSAGPQGSASTPSASSSTTSRGSPIQRASASGCDRFLAIAAKHGIRPLVVFFDDCWYEPVAGAQPGPRPGVHNSGWVRSPGKAALRDRGAWERLEAYVRDVVGRHASDERVLGWDVYNEVTNGFLPILGRAQPWKAAGLAAPPCAARSRPGPSIRLLERAVEWIRACRPAQPLTAGVWFPDRRLNARLIELSDVVSFHHYREPREPRAPDRRAPAPRAPAPLHGVHGAHRGLPLRDAPADLPAREDRAATAGGSSTGAARRSSPGAIDRAGPSPSPGSTTSCAPTVHRTATARSS